jgi:glycosyltransferase involved in cell wall biosynthesis
MISRDIESQMDEDEVPSKCQKTCSNWFDTDFFKSVISVKDIFCPMSWKKPLWWGATTVALGGVIAIEVTTGAFSTAATYNNIGIMTVLYAVDPIVQTINIVAAKYPAALADYAKKDKEKVAQALETENINAEPHSAQHSPYGSEDENYHAAEVPPKDKEEQDSPYGSEHETVYDYMVADAPPLLETDLEREIKANHLKNKDIAVVIPTHLAADKIEATIRSLLIHVKPHQIFIIDNGHSDAPMDNTREVIARISVDINYVWGHKGNKTYAQLIGTFLANDFKYIYTSDDDMRVPRFFSFGAERINDNVKAVCYPILGVHPEPGLTNWWIRAQSLEYTLADCSKLAQDRFGDVLYPHGAASLWEKQIFMHVLHKHSAIFYAEDVQFGMLLQQIGYAMSMEAGACLDTVAPTSLFGPNPNFLQQRGRSWEMGRQSNYFKFLYQLFCVAPPTKSPINFIMHKFAEAYAVYTNTVDWMRFPLFLLMLRNPDYWIRLAIIMGAGYVPILGWNYIKLPINHRKDLQAGFFDILTFPIFKLIESAMSIYGIGRLLAVYGPNYTHKPTVQEFEDSFRQDAVALENEIYDDAVKPAMPPETYKTVMYGRFFRPAQGADEIEREFNANMYRVYQDAMIEAMEQGDENMTQSMGAHAASPSAI